MMKIRGVLLLVFAVSLAVLTFEFVVSAQNVTSVSTLCDTGCLLPPTGLLGWWPGDGNANDIQLGSNGTLMNGATFAPGLVGQAFSLDGVNAFVNVPDTPALHAVTTAVTVDAWINPQPAPSGGAWILARRDPFVSEGFGLAFSDDGRLGTQMQTNAYSNFVSAAAGVVQFNGQWQHVAMTADTATGQVLLYVNGQSVPVVVAAGSPTISGTFPNVSHLFIGQRQDSNTPEGAGGGSHYEGLIDEVEVYNRALSPTEIQAIFFAGARGKCKP
jgi:concanavalin A-like lectin/glucanase superfamily protein